MENGEKENGQGGMISIHPQIFYGFTFTIIAFPILLIHFVKPLLPLFCGLCSFINAIFPLVIQNSRNISSIVIRIGEEKAKNENL
jgi:hypothetical protein